MIFAKVSFMFAYIQSDHAWKLCCEAEPLLIVSRHVIISMYYLTSNRSQLTVESL